MDRVEPTAATGLYTARRLRLSSFGKNKRQNVFCRSVASLRSTASGKKQEAWTTTFLPPSCTRIALDKKLDWLRARNSARGHEQVTGDHNKNSRHESSFTRVACVGHGGTKTSPTWWPPVHQSLMPLSTDVHRPSHLKTICHCSVLLHQPSHSQSVTRLSRRIPYDLPFGPSLFCTLVE